MAAAVDVAVDAASAAIVVDAVVVEDVPRESDAD